MDKTEIEDAVEEATPDFSSVLGGILSNPEMLSMISSMADKLKGDIPTMNDTSTPNDAPKGDTEALKKVGDMAGLLAPLLSAGGGNSPANDNRTCLLRALKPYLSQGRSEAVDYIIKFSRISDVLKNLT